MTVLRGPLTINASWDLEGLGPNQSEPVVVELHWRDQARALLGTVVHPYYFGRARLAHWPAWALILALLVLVKENRRRQAWLILVPFLLLGDILWPPLEEPFIWLCTPFFAGDWQYAWSCVTSLGWLITAISATWLISPWLARFHAAIGTFLAVGLALGGGGAVAGGLAVDFRYLAYPTLALYTVWVTTLAAAFALSRLCCRRRLSRARFLAWLFVWLVVTVGAAFAAISVWQLCSPIGLSPPRSLLLPSLAPVVLPLAIVVYLLNLPFMLLLFASPLYHDRFCRLLRLPTASPESPLGESTGNAGTVASA